MGSKAKVKGSASVSMETFYEKPSRSAMTLTCKKMHRQKVRESFHPPPMLSPRFCFIASHYTLSFVTWRAGRDDHDHVHKHAIGKNGDNAGSCLDQHTKMHGNCYIMWQSYKVVGIYDGNVRFDAPS